MQFQRDGSDRVGGKDLNDALADEIRDDLLDEIDRETMAAAGFTYEPGEVYMTKSEPRLVRLISRLGCPPLGQFGTWWTGEDVTYGYEFKCSERNLGFETFNAMEVIAWAAS